MLQRDICERLKWQRVLISDLIEVGHHDLAPATEKFLALMEQHQATVEHHLETLLREIPSMPRSPHDSPAKPPRRDVGALSL